MEAKDLTVEKALKEIEDKGFVEIQNMYSDELLDSVSQTIERPLNTMTVNGRKGYVQQGNIRFLQNTLSWGRPIIDMYTNPQIIDVCDRYAGSPVHLSNFRIYRTLPSKSKGNVMNWHLDNKTDVYDFDKEQFITKVVPMDKGIIMIMYLSDVEDGGFQIVEGSHKWVVNEAQETWDHEEEKFKDQVITFNNKKRGTMIIYDYRCIHRAKPYHKGKIRTSLFAQFSPDWMPVGEPILLNVRDLVGLTEQQMRVLNFGKSPSTENWPIGNKAEVFNDLKMAEVMKFLVRREIKKYV
jgi:ectoine hydroxylase-related dioxygenase (phytanoyl-CoA dioxygenase family)